MLANRMIASGLLAALVSTPVIAQRYADDDSSGSINLWIWGALIAFLLYRFFRNRIRHWLNPQKAEAEDKAEEEKGRAVRKHHDDQFDAYQKGVRAKEDEQSAKAEQALRAAGKQPTGLVGEVRRLHLRDGMPGQSKLGDGGDKKD